MRRRTARKKRSSRSLSLIGSETNRRSGAGVVAVLGALVVVNLYVFVWSKDTSVGAIADAAHQKTPAAAVPSQPLIAAAPTAPAHAGSAAAVAPVGPPGVIDGKVAKSDTLGRILKKSGLAAPEADEVIRSLSGVLDFKKIRAGQSFRIERGADGRVKKFEIVLGKIQTVRTERGADGVLTGRADTEKTHVETKAFGGRIDSSLYMAIKNAGENPGLVDFFVDVFAYDLDFYNDTHEGDTFRVVVERETKGGPEGELLRYRKILAAEYAGRAGTFRAFAWGDGFYRDNGESLEKTLLKTPLKFQRVSSGFDRKRMHPILHTQAAHLGIDYAAPTGTPVWAAAAGTVVQRGMTQTGAGNLVVIRHAGGIETAYMHLSKFADIKVGQKIAAKTVIGYVGTTGLSTGPHLHFGVRQNGGWIDPSKLTPVRAAGVTARDLDAFRTEVTALSAKLAALKIAAP